jgi:hypothetical protein
MHGHLHVIQPLSAQNAAQQANPQSTPQVATPKVTQAPDPAIVELARNDDLNVATIAREARSGKSRRMKWSFHYINAYEINNSYGGDSLSYT